MEHYVYSLRDKKLGAFDLPFYRSEDQKHVVEMTARSLKRASVDDYAKLRDQALYYLGVYEDLHGSFILLPQPEKLLDCEDFLPSKEDLLNGKDESSES